MESVRDHAALHPLRAHRVVGHVRPPRPAARAQHRFPDRVVARRRPRRRAGEPFVRRLALAAAAALWGLAAQAEVLVVHGLSAFGDLKYPPDFAHFEYVNPDAPKGGSMTTTSTRANQTFDTLNAYTFRGDPPAGLAAPENLVYDTLMAGAADESDAVYGLVASHAEYIPGGDWIIFEMRPEARFADGSALTAEDVVFSFEALKSEQATPGLRLALRDVTGAEALGPHRVRFTFAEEAAKRDLPMLVASLPIFSKAWFEGRAFGDPVMEQPLGSGPYEIEAVEAGRFVTYRRRDDYWARDLPVNVGRWNFDRITFEYFRDRSAAIPALQAGQLDLHESFNSREWATAYDFEAVRQGRVIREELPDESPSGTQGFWFNTRRPQLADPRVRQALGMAFDFEWSNRTLFYDLYERTTSFFQSSAMMAEGHPSPEELALLEPFRDTLPPAVFEDAYLPPVSDGSGQNRRALREASRLLSAAGWEENASGQRVNAAGERLAVEFFDDSAAFERIVNPYIQNLRAIGVDARFRLIDAAQAQQRVREFDYDVNVARFVKSSTPGVSLLNFYHSSSADQPGSFNLTGIADPAVDHLVETMIAAPDRETLHVAGRALDRVLRAKHIWAPHWFKASHTIAYWDMFDRPGIKPRYSRAILDTWWWDADRAAALGPRGN
ncbi:MAG: ABC transporter substrate-binding protein [Rhodobacteraceae bacterium]|nr:MAG: ABC transporter substrate-binding protein [Paracoccaceae bacterium]